MGEMMAMVAEIGRVEVEVMAGEDEFVDFAFCTVSDPSC